MAPETEVPAKEALQSALHLNFLEWLVRGEFRHLRSRWDLGNRCGVVEKWKQESRAADCRVRAPDGFRNDMNRWWEAWGKCPYTKVGVRGTPGWSD